MAQKNDLKNIKKIVIQYLQFLEKKIKIDISKAYLYGSLVKGKNNEFSDIDLAIVSDKFKGDRFEDIKKIYKYVKYFDVRIEPMPFTKNGFTKHNPFVKEIIKTGIKII